MKALQTYVRFIPAVTLLIAACSGGDAGTGTRAKPKPALTLTAAAVKTVEDSPVSVLWDVETTASDDIKIVVDTKPAHGTLTEKAGEFTYTPAPDYNGEDSVTGHAEAGDLVSGKVTVKITVSPVNDAPVAKGFNVSTRPLQAVSITLAATDADGDALTFALDAGPAHGTAALSGGKVTYTPAAGYTGADSFTYRANDGSDDSAPAVVNIDVNNLSGPPAVTPSSVATDEDVTLEFALNLDTSAYTKYTYVMVTDVQHGQLRFGKGKSEGLAIYNPAQNYFGPDSFSFYITDGQAQSATFTIAITVRAVNDLPVAAAIAASVTEDTPRTLTLSATDVENDAFTFSIAQAPAHGTAYVTGTTLTYVPAKDFFGSDSFSYRASDSQPGNPAAINLTVANVNDAPLVYGGTFVTAEDTRFAVPITDVDGDKLVFASSPTAALGRFVQNGNFYDFVPFANVSGSESFALTVSDGVITHAPVNYTITVNAVNDPPSMRYSHHAVEFGTDGEQYVDVGDWPALEMTGAFTLEAWIYPESDQRDSVIAGREGEFLLRRAANGTIQYALNVGGDCGWCWSTTSGVAPLNKWTHVALTYTGSVVWVYVNGRLIYGYSRCCTIGDAEPDLDSFEIGRRQGDWDPTFVGKINDVRLWNVARTAQELSDFNWYPPATDSTGLVGWWRMEEGYGVTVTDVTGNGSDGVVTGAAGWATSDDRFFMRSTSCCAAILSIQGFDPEGDAFYPTIMTGPTMGVLYQFNGSVGAQMTTFPARIDDSQGRVYFVGGTCCGFNEAWFGAAVTNDTDPTEIVPVDLTLIGD